MKKKWFLLSLSLLLLVSCGDGNSDPSPDIGAVNNAPTVVIGANGNWYINGEDTHVKATGEKGEDGKSPTITIGENGNWFIDGVDTENKATGQKGEKGSSFLTGNGSPAFEEGSDGDFYIDLDTYDFYEEEAGTWIKKGNIQGKQGEIGETGEAGKDGVDGENGKSLLTGNGAPSEDLGVDGDSYIDLDSYDFYRKETGTWVKKGNIKGKDGKDAEPPEKKYSVTWKNWDGSILEVDDNLSYGVTPTYDGSTPTKQKEGEKLFAFSGWCPAVGPVDSDITYWAQYSSEVATYTVTWENYDGTILEQDENVPSGAMPSYDGETPTKPSDNEKTTYVFTGWSMNLNPVYSDVTYVAQFREDRFYTVTWENYDGTVLETDKVRNGAYPTYDGEEPTKPGQGETEYVFEYWADIKTGSRPNNVYEDKTYKASFLSRTKTYDVVFKDEDGSFYFTTTITKGSLPYCPTPKKEGTTQGKCYVFQGWYVEGDASKTLVRDFTIEKDITFVALFEEKDTYSFHIAAKANGEQYAILTALNDPDVTDVVVPDTYQGVSVTTIGNEAFEDSDITSVTLPESVTDIGVDAFRTCPFLASVSLPSHLKTIGNGAFLFDRSLTSIVLPDSVTTIGGNAFEDCYALSSAQLPSNLTTISDALFSDCSSLTTITIPDTVTKIDDLAFYKCTSLTSIRLPSGLKHIGSQAFENCTALANIDLPEGLEEIEARVFHNCTSLTSVILPSTIRILYSEIFLNDFCNVYLKATLGYSTRWKDGLYGSIAFYSDTENKDGSHWHYDSDGKTPVLW